jgi:hypothetical protein
MVAWFGMADAKTGSVWSSGVSFFLFEKNGTHFVATGGKNNSAEWVWVFG